MLIDGYEIDLFCPPPATPGPSEMTLPLRDTEVYRAASKYCCRNSCIVPAATLKASGSGGEPVPGRGCLHTVHGGRAVMLESARPGVGAYSS